MNTNAKRIGWVVDVQNDFMNPRKKGGRLYVQNLFDGSDPGANLVRERIVESVEWMRENCDALVFTGDWHSYADEEIDPLNPDPNKGTYPPHCMGLSENPDERKGAELIPEIAPKTYLPLTRDMNPEEARMTAILAAHRGAPVYVKKNRFSVFEGNPVAEDFLEALQDELGGDVEIVVSGVATDVCVTHAVDGMLARGYRVTVLKDAIYGLGLESDEAAIARWTANGAQVKTLQDLRG